MVRTRRPSQPLPEPTPEADTLDTLPLNVIPLWPGMKLGEPAPSTTRRHAPDLADGVTSAPDLADDVTEETGKNSNGRRRLRGAVSSSHTRENDVTSHPLPNGGMLPRAEFLALVDRLSLTELRARFSLEASVHYGMVRRRTKEYAGCVIAPEFKDFKTFLRDMGQRPSSDWSIDRKNPSRLEYGPGLCRWADKREQANNRRSTIMLRNADGEIRPLTEWARLTGQNPNTMRVRLARGWTHAEVITGRRGVLSPETPDPVRPARPMTTWPEGTKQPSVWEAAWLDFGRRFPSNLSRAAFLAWVCSNVARHARASLGRRFPAFEEGYDDEPDGYAEDADRLMIDSAETRIQAAYRDMAGDREQHETLSALVRRWPHVRHPADVAKLVSRDDGE